MTYRGVTYNLPIDMYLVQEYPIRPPTVFIRPVSSMAIKENHRHVGLDGRVYLPYLHEWKGNTHDLRELVVWMSSLFGSEPPCYAKPTGTATTARPVVAVSNGNRNGHHNNPPAYAQATTVSTNGGQSSSYVTAQSITSSSAASSYNTATSSATTNNSDEERRRAFEKEIADANMAAETARRAAAEEHRLKVEQQRLEREHEQNLLSLRTMATSKVQFEIQNLFKELKDDLRITLKNQKQLEDGTKEIQSLIKEGKERKLQLSTGKDNIEKEIEKLEVWLTAVKNEQEQSDKDENNSRQCTADLISLPADTHSAQMLALSAENAAIDDCIYFLDRALVRGSIGLDVFLKEVRRLSKRQFLAKVCLCFVYVFVGLSFYMYL